MSKLWISIIEALVARFPERNVCCFDMFMQLESLGLVPMDAISAGSVLDLLFQHSRVGCRKLKNPTEPSPTRWGILLHMWSSWCLRFYMLLLLTREGWRLFETLCAFPCVSNLSQKCQTRNICSISGFVCLKALCHPACELPNWKGTFC